MRGVRRLGKGIGLWPAVPLRHVGGSGASKRKTGQIRNRSSKEGRNRGASCALGNAGVGETSAPTEMWNCSGIGEGGTEVL